MVPARIVTFGMLATCVVRVALGAESAVQQDSIGKMGVATLLQNMQITAENCAGVAPNISAEFESLISELTPRIWSIGDGLLRSEAFRDLRDKPVPAAMVERMTKEFQSRKRLDAIGATGPRGAGLCLEKLKVLRQMEYATLVTEVANALWLMRVILKDIDQPGIR